MEKKWSVGLTIIGWIFIITSAFNLIKFGLSFINFHLPPDNQKFARILIESYIMKITNEIAYLVGGIGILKFFQWARKLIIGIATIGLIFLLINWPTTLVFFPLRMRMLLSVLIILFFTWDKVKEQFK